MTIHTLLQCKLISQTYSISIGIIQLQLESREPVRDLLALMECGKLCNPLTTRAIPKRFCDGVAWLAHKAALLYQVSFTFTFTLPGASRSFRVRGTSQTSSRIVRDRRGTGSRLASSSGMIP